MIAEERWQLIIAEVRARKFVSVPELSGKFQVTSRTLRRDLEELEKRGLLRRTYGGAVWTGDSHSDRLLSERAVSCHAEKVRIGKAGAAMVSPGEAIILDAGTTTMEVARHLPIGVEITVSTNAIDIARELAGKPGITTVVCGGVLRDSTLSLVGPQAEQAFRSLSVDKAFIATSGISLEYGFSNSNPIESGAKKAMIAAAREVIVVADHSKISKASFSPFASFEDVDLLITDDGAPKEEVEAIKKRGTEVLLV